MHNERMSLVREKISTTQRNEITDITPRVRDAVRRAGIASGLVVVYVPHTTAAVTINENADPDVKSDVLRKLGELIPKNERYYEHGEGNSDSHLKTALVGPSVTLIVDAGKLVLGQWQGVYFCEFDGPREREFFVKILAS